MRLRLRTVILGIVILAALAVASPIALFVVYLVTNDEDHSPEAADRLRAIVEPIADPESGLWSDREFRFKRFENGEWVLGVSRDSHGWMSKYRGGGTVVVKDSRGQLRCFFGHVCGPGGHEYYMTQARSLDSFYQTLLDHNAFTEYRWP
jgi:hypothetical protein